MGIQEPSRAGEDADEPSGLRVRAWLRERVGPDAEVERVWAEGPLVHLEGVKLPIGPRGQLLLERATALLATPSGQGAGLPGLRLQGFQGTLSFQGAERFCAEVAFVAAPVAHDDAWIEGELTIAPSSWSVQNARMSEAPLAPAPMAGRARLVVTASSWTLEAASVALQGARGGPIASAIQAVVGRLLDIPPAVPLDARLEGTVAWDATTGARASLRVTAPGLEATVTGTTLPDGRGLSARALGDVSPALAMRAAHIAEALLPRGEDRLSFVVDASGDLARPDLHATLRGAEVGFRFGRPRFQPAHLARGVEVVIDLEAGAVATVRASARLGVGTLALEATGAIARGGLRPVDVRVTDLEASWIVPAMRALLGTSRVRTEDDGPTAGAVVLPRAARMSVAVTFGAGRSIEGQVTLKTPHSTLALAPFVFRGGTLDGTTVRGTVALRDALALGAFAGVAVRPLPEGEAHVEATLKGPIDDCVVSAFVTAPVLRLALHEGERRADTSPVLCVTELSTLLRVDAARLVWHRLAARAYGGTLGSAGVIDHSGPFVGVQATVAARGVSVGDLPVDDAGGTLAAIARGRMAIDMRFEQQAAGPVLGRGDVQLEEGAFPVLARSKTALGKYGLAPPAEHAVAPATCSIHLHERGWSFCDARAAVVGCEAIGRVDVLPDGALDGALVVTLGQELLETSAMTMLPSLLAEHLTVPVRITGRAARPQVQADLAACFGSLVTNNRVSAMFSEAASDVASLFTGKDPVERPRAGTLPPPAPRVHPDPYGLEARGSADEEDALTRDLVASGAEWDEIDARIEAHRRSRIPHRIG